MMTNERLAEIERFAAAATEGPWEAEASTIHGILATAHVRGVCGAFYQDDPSTHQQTTADFDFIALARAAVPELVAEVRRLRAERDAIIRLCYHPSESRSGNWYHRVHIDPADGSDLDKRDFHSEAKAIAAVRTAAGLDASETRGATDR